MNVDEVLKALNIEDLRVKKKKIATETIIYDKDHEIRFTNEVYEFINMIVILCLLHYEKQFEKKYKKYKERQNEHTKKH